MSVTFSNADKKHSIKNASVVKSFIDSIFDAEGLYEPKLTYIFCSDEYLLNINKQFLNHDYYTDIISFDLSNDHEDFVRGEIYVSLERVEDNAKQFDAGVDQELLRVLFHGALHLCGYKDKTKSEIKEMRYKEDYYLRLYNESIEE
ncbi:rRNA maturation RNase YbeY [Polluticaenibacter yanchengensis]|uniref:Endoribonuclease YbeY n=1 Tax=Polluticaenibacter yanchengensis TaxID=3014562 RepID=A0ABT4UR82_9BACT|nr:rRNA maturation RNase YbeY [Chitinophagaceae bacterium LY-5]